MSNLLLKALFLLMYAFSCQLVWIWNIAHYYWWGDSPSKIECGVISVVAIFSWVVLRRKLLLSVLSCWIALVGIYGAQVAIFGVEYFVDSKGTMMWLHYYSRWGVLLLLPIALVYSLRGRHRAEGFFYRYFALALLIAPVYFLRGFIPYDMRRIMSLLFLSLYLGLVGELCLKILSVAVANRNIDIAVAFSNIGSKAKVVMGIIRRFMN